MEVDHPFQMFPHLLKFIAFASPSFFFEAFHFIVIFLEKFLDDVFVFIEEVFLLSHLHVFLERLVFNHFIEIVDFEDAVRNIIVAVFKVAFVLEEEESDQESYVLPLGLEPGVCFYIEEIVEEFHGLTGSDHFQI